MGAGTGDQTAMADLVNRFDGRLEFGTAGLRGELGAGPMRMNRVLVAQAAAPTVKRVAQELGDALDVRGRDLLATHVDRVRRPSASTGDGESTYPRIVPSLRIHSTPSRTTVSISGSAANFTHRLSFAREIVRGAPVSVVPYFWAIRVPGRRWFSRRPVPTSSPRRT